MGYGSSKRYTKDQQKAFEGDCLPTLGAIAKEPSSKRERGTNAPLSPYLKTGTPCLSLSWQFFSTNAPSECCPLGRYLVTALKPFKPFAERQRPRFLSSPKGTPFLFASSSTCYRITPYDCCIRNLSNRRSVCRMLCTYIQDECGPITILLLLLTDLAQQQHKEVLLLSSTFWFTLKASTTLLDPR
jgi:hypothetical protein